MEHNNHYSHSLLYLYYYRVGEENEAIVMAGFFFSKKLYNKASFLDHFSITPSLSGVSVGRAGAFREKVRLEKRRRTIIFDSSFYNLHVLYVLCITYSRVLLS